MYSNAPRIPSRGLGTGLLAGFFGWVIALVLAVGIGMLDLPYQLSVLTFALPVGASAWLVRPTSWGVPPLFTVLSIPGYYIAEMVRAVFQLSARLHTSPVLMFEQMLKHLDTLFRSYLGEGQSVALWAGTVVLVLVLSLTAVLFGRSRAGARPSPTGPRPGFPPGPQMGPPQMGPPAGAQMGPYGGPGPYGAQGRPGPAMPPPPGAGPPQGGYPPGPPPAYGPGPGPGPAAASGPAGPGTGPGPGYGPPQGPPSGPPGPPQGVQPAGPSGPPQSASPLPAPPPASGPAPGGTRRLDPDEFDQMLYEAEQERRAREE